MNDFPLFDAAPSAPADAEPLSVTQFTHSLRILMEESFGRVAIVGEVATLRRPGSGHVYFNLKDSENVLKGVMWRSTAARIAVQPEEGMQVIATGKVTNYGPRSEYQIVVDKLVPAGQGTLLQQLEERKKRLAAEGLFDEERKRKLPLLPQRIGIVTSPTGAVIDDMLHRLADRCPRPVVLCPVRVQGAGAAAEMVAALRTLNALPEAQRPDVLILARGGGSLEDLWEFNDEALVRAVAASAIPVVTGVGHEPDVTLVDYASDKRAPTPTAAMEMVVPVKVDLLATLAYQQRRLSNTALHRLSTLRQRVDYAARGIPNPSAQLNTLKTRVQQGKARFHYQANQQLKWRREQVKNLSSLLASYAPQGVLKRGFVYATAANGQPVTSAQTTEQAVTLHFKDGTRRAELN